MLWRGPLLLGHIPSSRNMVSLFHCPHSILNGPHSMLIRYNSEVRNSDSSCPHSMLMNSRSRDGMAPVMLLRAGMGVMGVQRRMWVGGVSG